MDDILLAVSVSFMAFLSTSIDNLFLLITLTLHPKYGSAKVRTGYLLAVLLMLGICMNSGNLCGAANPLRSRTERRAN